MRAKHIVMLAMVSALGLNGYGAWATDAGTQGGIGGGVGLKAASIPAGMRAGATLDLAASAATPARPDDSVAWEGVEGNRLALERDARPQQVDSQYPESGESEVHYTERERSVAQPPHRDERYSGAR